MLLSPVITQLVAGVITVHVLAGERAVPFESSAVMVNEAGAPFVLVPSKDEVIEMVELQLPGKKRMQVKDLLNGWKGCKHGSFV